MLLTFVPSQRLPPRTASLTTCVQRASPCTKEIKTDCSINASPKGKTYCFGNEQAKTDFMKNPNANLAKAQSYYSTKHPG